MKSSRRQFETIPLAEVLKKGVTIDDPYQEKNASQYELATTAKRKRVLVVDDERVIADTLTAIFDKAGYEAMAAYDGMTALLQCESFLPELVVTDVSMPGMNGIEMAILVTQRYPECRILLFSGQASTVNLLEEARTKGYDFELLTKPVHPKELLAKIA